MRKEVKELSIIYKSLIGTIPFTFFLSLILFFVTKNANAEIQSLFVGAMMSFVLNLWHYKMTYKYGTNDYKKLRLFTVFSYSFRYLLIVAVTTLGTIFAGMNAIYIIFGVLEYPIFLFLFSLALGKGGRINV